MVRSTELCATSANEPGSSQPVAGSALGGRSLDQLADEIRLAVARAESVFSESVAHAIGAGELLIEAKSRVRHGRWLPFVASVGIAARTAQKYMRLAKSVRGADLPPDISINAALDALAGNGRQAKEPDLWDRWVRVVGVIPQGVVPMGSDSVTRRRDGSIRSGLLHALSRIATMPRASFVS
jgi:hypothetical protein